MDILDLAIKELEREGLEGINKFKKEPSIIWDYAIKILHFIDKHKKLYFYYIKGETLSYWDKWYYTKKYNIKI